MVQQVSFVKTYCTSAVLCQLLSTPLQMPTRTRDFKDTILREERKILAAKRKADAIQRKADPCGSFGRESCSQGRSRRSYPGW